MHFGAAVADAVAAPVAAVVLCVVAGVLSVVLLQRFWCTIIARQEVMPRFSADFFGKQKSQKVN